MPHQYRVGLHDCVETHRFDSEERRASAFQSLCRLFSFCISFFLSELLPEDVQFAKRHIMAKKIISENRCVISLYDILC